MKTTRRKLIESAMPLDPINKASSREKSIRHGHPSTLHLWWSRKPLATCRAVLFAQIVDDPSSWPDLYPSEREQNAERERLFGIMQDLIVWENSNDEGVIGRARREIVCSIARNRGDELPDTYGDDLDYLQKYGPVIRDPFCGGGSIVLEAQRLGFRAVGSDLNPVATVISKATCEIPGRFTGMPAIHPEARRNLVGTTMSSRAMGLAEDILHYGEWIRTKAWARIGHLYPRIRIDENVAAGRSDLERLKGQELTVIAFLWVRTVASPDPVLRGAHVPLTSSFMLSTKPKSRAWCEPEVQRDGRTITYKVRVGDGQSPAKTVDRSGGRCLISGVSMPFPYIRAEGQAGRLGSRLMAIVVEGHRGRVFLPPTPEMETLAQSAQPQWKPDGDLPEKALGFRVQEYGMLQQSDLFTSRQLAALTTFSDLIAEVREEVIRDARSAGMSGDQTPLAEGGQGAVAYGDAIATYLALGVDKASDYWSSICSWHSSLTTIRNTFARQAIPMIWDYCETNPFSNSAGNWSHCCRWISKVVNTAPANCGTSISQDNAAVLTQQIHEESFVFATDPPYYDNIGYADLSDYFYVWLRRPLKLIWPDLFITMQVPKADEIIASPHRHGSRDKARQFFMERMNKALEALVRRSDSDFPSSIFYAYKQTETNNDGTISTGWASFLQAAVDAGFTITGTWPIRTEMSNRSVAANANALASSVVLACRKQTKDAPVTTRGQFLSLLRQELPAALQTLQTIGIAPVDLAQAAVGQGMRVFTQYRAVLESDDSRMLVRTALQLINSVLDESLETQDVEYDRYTRFALTWFESFGMQEEVYGEAEKLGIAKDVSIDSMKGTLLKSQGGKVRLLKPNEVSELAPEDPVWKCVHRIIWLNDEEGEYAAASSMASLPNQKKDAVKEIAYRLYRICENNRWADLSRDYNSLIASWEGISSQSKELETGEQQQLDLPES